MVLTVKIFVGQNARKHHDQNTGKIGNVLFVRHCQKNKTQHGRGAGRHDIRIGHEIHGRFIAQIRRGHIGQKRKLVKQGKLIKAYIHKKTNRSRRYNVLQKR